MSMVKGKLDLTISLDKSSCYFLRTGKCSLNVVTGYFITPTAKTAPDDLLYCPRLYRAMCNRERMKPITVLPCECGHAQVISGRQRACIAAQKDTELPVRAAGDEVRAACEVCGSHGTAQGSIGGDRIVTITALVDKDA